MSDLAITAEHLSKQYLLGHHVDLTRSFRETVMEIPRQTGRRLKNWLRPSGSQVTIFGTKTGGG
jgi:hypothetical protein